MKKKIRDHKELEKRRFKAGKMFKKGVSQYRVAKHFQVATSTTNAWHKAWSADAQDGLKSKGHPGFKSKYTKEKKKELKRILLKGPTQHGYTTDFWTLERIRAVAKKKLKVTLGTKRTWLTVISLGFSVQRPERRAKERNEEAITTWKIKTFQRLKKMGV